MNIKVGYLSVCLCVWAGMLRAQTSNIKNDRFWTTVEGKPIYSQGGGIFRFSDPVTGVMKYYWYGVHYAQAEGYKDDPSITRTGSSFESVTCYSSSDLANWKFEADVLEKNEVNRNGRIGWVGRLGVAYIKELKKYALFVQHKGVLIATSDSPTGPFTRHQEISMQSIIGTPNTGDQTVFTDEDIGKSYLIYSYGRGRNKTYVSEIGVKDGKVDLLDCTKIFEGEGREGNCMFKYKSKYYACASDLYGWNASNAYYMVASDIRGPYMPANRMNVIQGSADDYGHVTQTGFFCVVKGNKQETVIFCGDRWADFAGNGLGYNQWCPLSFEGATPFFNSVNSWILNERTGEWQVGADNNWVRNGSFEADRKRIPSVIKPVQQQLTGWTTTVIKGRPISMDTLSPALNYNNNAADRKAVVGERSLYLSDQVDFSRKVSQVVSSSPNIKLTDGNYTLTAKIKNSLGLKRLAMYAQIGSQSKNCTFANEHPNWKTVRLEHIPVKEGSIEIGFLIEGTGGAFCRVDDVELTKDL